MHSFRVDAKFNLTALTDESDDQRLSQLELQMDEHDDVLVNGNKEKMEAEERKRRSSELEDAYTEMATIPTAMAVKDGQVADMQLLIRGNHLTPSTVVPRGFPAVLPAADASALPAAESGRRELANWLSSRSNPLTARVIVNRIWHWHMGQGIVETVDNFGKLGKKPADQDLLDWLAIEFIRSGWSVKHLHRTIMISNVYRRRARRFGDPPSLDSLTGPDSLTGLDSLTGPFPPRRLEAEELRDSLLHISDGLNLEMHGKTLPMRNHKIMNGAEIKSCNAVHAIPRRTLYLPVIRSGLHEYLTAFDFPDPSMPVGKRNETTVAPQALYMMNSEFVEQAAQRLANRLIAEHPTESARIEATYLRVLGREPAPKERVYWSVFLQNERRSPEEVWPSVIRVLFSSNDFIYVK
jgi:hypothetical protein